MVLAASFPRVALADPDDQPAPPPTAPAPPATPPPSASPTEETPPPETPPTSHTDANKPPANPPPTAPNGYAETPEPPKESKRGLTWFWLEAEGGFEHVGLHTFNVNEQTLSAGFIDTEASGGDVGGGIGARFLILTLGLRGRMGFFNAWQLGRIGGELGIHIPITIFEPHFELGGGYAALGSFHGLVPVVPTQISIHGGYARATAGLDIYPISQLSLGAVASFDFMALIRDGVSPTDLTSLQSKNIITAAQSKLLAVQGSGYGATFSIQGVIGLHL